MSAPTEQPSILTTSSAPTTRALILRTCDKDMRSYGGFQWPRSGRVECPDWRATKSCGRGLHGFLHGEGDGGLASWEPDAVWIAAWIDPDLAIDLDGKVKFPWAEVAVAGTREEAIAFLQANGCNGPIVGSTITGGDGSTITGGYGATITGGDGATITGGDRSTITGGDRSTITGGYGSTITGGDRSTITGGYGATITGGYGATITGGDRSTITGGYGATITGGDGATITGGYGSTITGGYGATITGGDGATITGGHGSTITGGYRSTIVVRYWNGEKYRTAMFEVGEDGVQPNVAYRCNESGKLEAVQAEEAAA